MPRFGMGGFVPEVHGVGGSRRRGTVENPNSVRLTADNVTFLMQNGLLYMKQPQDAEAVRVQLHRNFPYEFLWDYISVLDIDGYELAHIVTMDDLDEEMREILRLELERKYYAPVIRKILSVKERFGFSYWGVETSAGNLTFTLQDTFKSIIRADGGRLFLLDVDGNRFEIEDVEKLDRRSYKKIELYL